MTTLSLLCEYSFSNGLFTHRGRSCHLTENDLLSIAFSEAVKVEFHPKGEIPLVTGIEIEKKNFELSSKQQ